MGIPVGMAGRPASIKGHLIDGSGNIVRVETEEDCFRLCGMEYIPPTQRSGFVERQRMEREHLSR
jgi:DNA polymerase/3'-5' exonuclease PolX